MKILHIANNYFMSGIYRELFAAERKLGLQLSAFVPLPRNAKELSPSEPDVLAVKCFRQYDRLLFFSKQKHILSEIEQSYSVGEFDGIHAHTVFSGGYAAMELWKKYGIPYIVAVRNTDLNVFFPYMVHLRKIGIQILLNAKHVVFLSDAYRQRLLEQYVPKDLWDEINRKSEVIPNGISHHFLEHPGQPRQLEPDALRLIFAGKIYKEKNPEMLLKAHAILRSRGIPAELTVIGPIVQEKYRKLLESAEAVCYLPACHRQEMLQHYRNADIFVMPSHSETFGLVYAEAMSQGLPVIYTMGEGFDGQFPDGTVGYAVNDRDPEDIADKIMLAAKNYNLLSQNCISLAKRFDWAKIARRYQELYKYNM